MSRLELTLIGVIIILIALFGAYVKYTKPEPINTTAVLVSEEVLKDSVSTEYIPPKKPIITAAKSDTILIYLPAEEDSAKINYSFTAVKLFKPDRENLKGDLQIKYFYPADKFEFNDNLIPAVKTVTKTVVKTYTKKIPQKPPWIRPKIGLGWYGTKQDGSGQVSCGVILFDTVSINASGLSTGKLGFFVEYIF
jgi:hypothetical protein